MVAAQVNPDMVETVVLNMLSRRGLVLGLYSRLARDRFETWIVTQPLTLVQELEFYGIAGALRTQFPDVDVTVHVEHSGMYAGDANPFDAVPLDAHRFGPDVR